MGANPLRRVLLVEDDEVVARLGRRILERAGFTVSPVLSAEGALDVALSEYDVVVTDVGLPGMSGRQLVRQLRERSPNLPIVVASGYAEGSDDHVGDLPPDVVFIQKPFSPRSLVAGVVDVLARRARPSDDGASGPGGKRDAVMGS